MLFEPRYNNETHIPWTMPWESKTKSEENIYNNSEEKPKEKTEEEIKKNTDEILKILRQKPYVCNFKICNSQENEELLKSFLQIKQNPFSNSSNFFTKVIKNNPFLEMVEIYYENNKSQELSNIIENKLKSINFYSSEKELESLDMDDEMAYFCPGNQELNINPYINMNIYSPNVISYMQQGNIAGLLSIFGHEYCHALQHAFKDYSNLTNLTEECQKYYKNMKSDIESLHKNDRELYEIYITLQTFSNDMNQLENNKLIKLFEHKNYFEQKHEVEARRFGTIFAKSFFKKLKKDILFNELKDIVNDELIKCYEIEKNNTLYEKQNLEALSEFEQGYKNFLRNIDNETILALANSYYGCEKPEGKNKTELEDIAKNNAITGWQILKTKTDDEIIKLFAYADKNQSSELIAWITTFVSDFPERKALKENLINYIINDIKNNAFTNSNYKDWMTVVPYKKFFTPNDVLKILDAYIDINCEPGISSTFCAGIFCLSSINDSKQFDEKLFIDLEKKLRVNLDILEDESIPKEEKMNPGALSTSFYILHFYTEKTDKDKDSKLIKNIQMLDAKYKDEGKNFKRKAEQEHFKEKSVDYNKNIRSKYIFNKYPQLIAPNKEK